MSKAIDKSYLLTQLKNFDSEILEEKYSVTLSEDEGNIIEKKDDGSYYAKAPNISYDNTNNSLKIKI